MRLEDLFQDRQNPEILFLNPFFVTVFRDSGPRLSRGPGPCTCNPPRPVGPVGREGGGGPRRGA